MRIGDAWAAKNARVDFTYLSSVWAPPASEEMLRLLVDWNNWASTHGLLTWPIQY